MKLKLGNSMCPAKNCTALVRKMSMRIDLEGMLVITVECENGHKTVLHYEKSAVYGDKTQ